MRNLCELAETIALLCDAVSCGSVNDDYVRMLILHLGKSYLAYWEEIKDGKQNEGL